MSLQLIALCTDYVPCSLNCILFFCQCSLENVQTRFISRSTILTHWHARLHVDSCIQQSSCMQLESSCQLVTLFYYLLPIVFMIPYYIALQSILSFINVVNKINKTTSYSLARTHYDHLTRLSTLCNTYLMFPCTFQQAQVGSCQMFHLLFGSTYLLGGDLVNSELVHHILDDR